MAEPSRDVASPSGCAGRIAATAAAPGSFGAGVRWIVIAAGSIVGDRHAFQPHFTIADVRVGLTQARLAIAERLHLGSREDESRLPRFQEMVIVPCTRISGDGNFFHGTKVKIRIDLGLYNDLDCRSAKIAEVVELVDALASGASGRKPVGVRVPPSAYY